MMKDYLYIILIILAIITVMMVIDVLFYRTAVETEIGTALICEKIDSTIVCIERP